MILRNSAKSSSGGERLAPPEGPRKRILIFVVAYNAEKTIQSVIRRIPASLAEHDTQILIIDDSSADRTFERAREYGESAFPVTVLFNPVNQGYGGNQKIGFHYAIQENFDFVALVHGDGQYAPECLPELLQPLLAGEADAVFGSRMIGSGEARKGGMPLYKFVGNRILTGIQNYLLNTSLSEFHSGYRVYSTAALKRIPFERNTNVFHFDTEIIIQLVRAGCRIKELPIPTFYGEEVCHVNGMKYAADVVRTTLLSRIQELGIFYERKYDFGRRFGDNARRRMQWGFESPYSLALKRVPPGSKVLALGAASESLTAALHEKGCEVARMVLAADPEAGSLPDAGAYRYILLLDALEHLHSPEAFAAALRNSRKESEDATVILSTANVAFFVTRLMLLLGFFNYGTHGILNLANTRLFTFASLRHLLEQAGFQIVEMRGVPAPFPLALGDRALARGLVAVNRRLIRLSKSLFSYQIFMVVRPLPTVNWLLVRAISASRMRAAEPELTRVANCSSADWREEKHNVS
jgi:glycosyltransferase involved in cell wall biosynthesis